MTVHDQSPEDSMLATLAASELPDVLADVAELGLDAELADGVLREIPVLGTLLRMARTAGVVRNHLFARKLARFLTGYQKVPRDERDRFIASLDDPNERHRVGTTLLLVLDRCDSMDKPQLIALLFAGVVSREIHLDTFQRFVASLERIHVSLLPLLIRFYREQVSEDYNSESAEYQELSAAGLLGVEFTGGYGRSGQYVRTGYGATFVRLLTQRNRAI